MANNKVQLADGTTLIDLTEDTVTPENLGYGAIAHDKSGTIIIGTFRVTYLDPNNNGHVRVVGVIPSLNSGV